MTRLLPVFALSAVLLTAGCSAPIPDQSNDAATAAGDTRLASVGESGILKVCTTGDYRPFTYLDPETGDWSGIDITMAKDLAESLDVEAEFIQTSWKDLMPDFLSKCDIGVGGVSISMERAQQAYYSEATLDEGKTPITLCENVEKYDTVKEINTPGVRSITPIGGTNEKFAEANYPEGEIIRFENNNTIFDEIIAGRADVMTTDASETRWVANEHPQLCAVHPDKPFNFSQKAYLLPLGDEKFQEYVDQWLNMAKHDGTLAAAEKPWFG
ncbi:MULTISPECIES: transporter substrate-binding domain-containing protein [unclassified Arthrobacter]|uniref:transporter substrate-binding domain-containing protein n=1 Tax=unclassified Arthrobacter TaxID=235627 RepID=UPI00215709B7|nr:MULTISPECIES: transporter substrate-binding domain-containing protein [unclassified Arthrobacter]